MLVPVPDQDPTALFSVGILYGQDAELPATLVGAVIVNGL